MQKYFSLKATFFTGIAVLAVAIALAELFSGPQHGHRIDFDALPPQAKEILNEKPGIPVSPEQWSRFDRVMSQHPGLLGAGQLLSASMRYSWYWFVLLPLVALGFVRLKHGKLTLPIALLLVSPSLLVLAYAFSTATHSALR